MFPHAAADERAKRRAAARQGVHGREDPVPPADSPAPGTVRQARQAVPRSEARDPFAQVQIQEIIGRHREFIFMFAH